VVDAGIGYTGSGIELDLFGHWQSSYRDFAGNLAGGLLPFTVHDYVTVSGRVAYNPIGWLTLALIGQQFNQARCVQTAGPRVERRVFGSITVRY
jgi:hypothetical protein